MWAEMVSVEDTQEDTKGEQLEISGGTCDISGFHFILQETWGSPWITFYSFLLLDQSSASSNLANADPATQLISLVDLFTGWVVP